MTSIPISRPSPPLRPVVCFLTLLVEIGSWGSSENNQKLHPLLGGERESESGLWAESETTKNGSGLGGRMLNTEDLPQLPLNLSCSFSYSSSYGWNIYVIISLVNVSLIIADVYKWEDLSGNMMTRVCLFFPMETWPRLVVCHD